MPSKIWIFGLLFIFSSFILSGCGQDSKIQSAIKAQLKDPDSAKFRKLEVNEIGSLACAEWNAKNSFGGMGGWNNAEVKNVNGTWIVSDMEATKNECTPEYLQRREKYLERQILGDLASEKAQSEAIKMIEQSRNISNATALELTAVYPRGDCYAAVSSYGYAAKAIVEDFVRIEAEKFTKLNLKFPEGELGKSMANPPSNKHKKDMEALKQAFMNGSCPSK